MKTNTKSKKFVYFFGEGNTKDKLLLGGKGANLGEMTKMGLPVPPGFTITTETCDYFYKNKNSYPSGLQEQIDKNIKKLEDKMGFCLGNVKRPLLLSIRSGAAVSMPGMMDTVLNLGLNEKTLKGLKENTGNERFAWDSYRRFVQMFGNVVMDVEHKHFEGIITKAKKRKDIHYDYELGVDDLKKLVKDFKAVIKKETKKDFPNDIKKQLKMAIDAVFSSWNNSRAIKYRKINDIKGLIGTAVNVQTMIFGNMGEDSCTGVAFTRNPSTGENKFYGEYLINAQGEDVVAGIRTPKSIDKLKKEMPVIYKQLYQIRNKLEKHYKDMQDLEFTVQKGKLFILQTRNGKRTGPAAVKIAVDMVKEGLIKKEEAIMRVAPSKLEQLLHKRIDPKEKKKPLGKGLPASPGASVGRVVFTAEDALVWSSDRDEKVILVRNETSPEDIEGMHVAEGILTARGGMTSHAAVVARGMGKCCIAGCGKISIDEENNMMTVGFIKIKEGDYITLDGTTGEFYLGELPVIDPIISDEFGVLMEWAKKVKKMEIMTNADNPHDAKVALDFGAEGIGLCRTEHMFFEEDRINSMREMIIADNEKERRIALDKLLPHQVSDFVAIFKVMNNKPVIIRLLDPPLHEFLPKTEGGIKTLSRTSKTPEKTIRERISKLHEFNPMLGFRGCRIGVVYPEISEMQAKAIFKAALKAKKAGKNPKPMIEVPNIIDIQEFRKIKEIILKAAKETGAQGKIKYQIGTMIEFPRASLTADAIAKESDFISFGTNDLTQTTLGFSRDDAGKFISCYLDSGILEKDPFQTIDKVGVGQLMEITIKKANKVKKGIEIGVCGEHGGDPESVKYFHSIGLTNVSASPYRVPIAILSAAQAALKTKK
ncbi:MAG: pyruvate, phosphate dikinase [Candidatus Aenigmatarchaeota archaeon]